MDKLTSIRIEQTRAGYIDAGEWHKPRYAVFFTRGQTQCKVPIVNNGEVRPLGQDLLNAMKPYLDRKQTSADELFAARIID